MTDAQLRAAGLFDVVMPEDYDSQIHDLGEIFLGFCKYTIYIPKDR